MVDKSIILEKKFMNLSVERIQNKYSRTTLRQIKLLFIYIFKYTQIIRNTLELGYSVHRNDFVSNNKIIITNQITLKKKLFFFQMTTNWQIPRITLGKTIHKDREPQKPSTPSAFENFTKNLQV